MKGTFPGQKGLALEIMQPDLGIKWPCCEMSRFKFSPRPSFLQTQMRHCNTSSRLEAHCKGPDLLVVLWRHNIGQTQLLLVQTKLESPVRLVVPRTCTSCRQEEHFSLNVFAAIKDTTTTKKKKQFKKQGTSVCPGQTCLQQGLAVAGSKCPGRVVAPREGFQTSQRLFSALV